MKFTVVGIYDRTYMTVTDSAAFVPLADAQQIFYRRLPDAFRGNVKPSELVLQANVYGDEGVDLDRLSERMTRDVEGVLASGPTKMQEAQGQIIDLITAMLWSIGVIALIVGTFSVVNTMTMAVGERTREIGVKRALGATRRRIRRDVLAESALMAALGGVGGLAAGVLVALAPQLRDRGHHRHLALPRDAAARGRNARVRRRARHHRRALARASRSSARSGDSTHGAVAKDGGGPWGSCATYSAERAARY